MLLDQWTEISYYQFPSFDLSFRRDIYERWSDNRDDEYKYITEEREGEDECWD